MTRRGVVERQFVYAVGPTTLPTTHAWFDVTTTFERAERLNGAKLDRRRRYAIIHGRVCFLVSYTSACSGCNEGNEHGGGERGDGCGECGFTGVRRNETWVPLDPGHMHGSAPPPLGSWETIDGSPWPAADERFRPETVTSTALAIR